jgi:hypothetical protein
MIKQDAFDRYNGSRPAKLIIAEETRDNIKFPDDKKVNRWVKEYDKFNLTEKVEFFQYMERFQALYIRECMKSMEQSIPIPKLGVFAYKEARKHFYELKQSKPDASLSDIINEVKEVYHQRKELKSNKVSDVADKNLSLVVVIPK